MMQADADWEASLYDNPKRVSISRTGNSRCNGETGDGPSEPHECNHERDDETITSLKKQIKVYRTLYDEVSQKLKHQRLDLLDLQQHYAALKLDLAQAETNAALKESKEKEKAAKHALHILSNEKEMATKHALQILEVSNHRDTLWKENRKLKEERGLAHSLEEELHKKDLLLLQVMSERDKLEQEVQELRNEKESRVSEEGSILVQVGDGTRTKKHRLPRRVLRTRSLSQRKVAPHK